MANWLALGLAVALLLPAQEKTVTKDDFRTQPPARTDRQLRDQLWSIFEKEDQRRATSARRPLDDVWLTTRAYPTEVPGLCRKDNVILYFAPTERAPEEVDAQTPVRAYGVKSFPYFHFLRAPDRSYQEASDYSDRTDKWSGPCSRLSDDNSDWFSAPDEETAVEGYRAGRFASAAFAAGTARISKCGRETRSAIASKCEAVIVAFAKTRLAAIEACEAPYGASCFKLSGAEDAETRVTIVDDPDVYRSATGTSVAQHAVIDLQVDFPIVLAEQPVD